MYKSSIAVRARLLTGVVTAGALAVGCAGSAGDEGSDDEALHGQRHEPTPAENAQPALDKARLETDAIVRAWIEILSDKKSLLVGDIPRIVEAYRLASANTCALLHAGTSIPVEWNAELHEVTCRTDHEVVLQRTINGHAAMKRDWSPDTGWYPTGIVEHVRNFGACYQPWLAATHYDRWSIVPDLGPAPLEPSRALVTCLEEDTEHLEETLVKGIERRRTRPSSAHESVQMEVKLVFDAQEGANAKICEALGASAPPAGEEHSPGPEVSALLCRATLTSELGASVDFFVW